MDLSIFSQFDVWMSLLTLIFLEIVLGIDNVIFIGVMVSKLPAEIKTKARIGGLALALLVRIALLSVLTWAITIFTTSLFTVHLPPLGLEHHDVSVRDMILFFGGLFLLYKGAHEIHHLTEGADDDGSAPRAAMWMVLMQIVWIDVVFSLDSIITAIGMTSHLPIMIIAVVVSIGVMMVASQPVSGFIQKHPSAKLLALAFLLLIGTTLMAEGLGFHMPKGYIYTAILFAVFVEALDMRRQKKAGNGDTPAH